MSTEVQQPVQPAPEQPVEEPKPETAENGGIPVNGEVKEEKKSKKEVIPIDPKEDFVGWFNFYVLQWAINLAYDDDSQKPKLPANEEITKSQFLNYLKDGQLLAKLANKLAPNSIETVKEGEENKTKEDNKANIEGFIKFVKEKAELNESQVFSVEDIQEKGKAGFNQVLNTIFQLAHVAQEKFQQQGIDLDVVITEIAGIAPKSIIEKIRTFVFNKLRRGSSVEKEATKEEGVKEEETKVENGTTQEQTTESAEEKKEAPAVTAN